MPECLFLKDILQVFQGPDSVLFPGSLADADDDILLIVQFDIRMIRGHTRQITLGRVHVEGGIHVAVKENVGVIDTGKGYNA